ncbi:Hypothetical protein D9617_6g093160 [Elsinoe fawcettii]|nr:Hypothetical protein D9617_6g093160 [Elsinoe fawcettii]
MENVVSDIVIDSIFTALHISPYHVNGKTIPIFVQCRLQRLFAANSLSNHKSLRRFVKETIDLYERTRHIDPERNQGRFDTIVTTIRDDPDIESHWKSHLILGSFWYIVYQRIEDEGLKEEAGAEMNSLSDPERIW